MEDKYQVLYRFKDSDVTYPTLVFATKEVAQDHADYANKHFKRNGAVHFLGPVNVYRRQDDIE